MDTDKHLYEMAVIQQEHAGREAQGILIFGSKPLDPATAPWSQVVSVYYLDEMLTELEKTSLDHPLLALFQPLIEKDTNGFKRKRPSTILRLKRSPQTNA